MEKKTREIGMVTGEEPELADTRGTALAAMAMAFGTIARLCAKGAFDLADIEYVFGGSLSAFEQTQSPNDPAMQVARALLDGMHGVAVAGLTHTRSTRQQ
jgi:hypothetical protein